MTSYYSCERGLFEASETAGDHATISDDLEWAGVLRLPDAVRRIDLFFMAAAGRAVNAAKSATLFVRRLAGAARHPDGGSLGIASSLLWKRVA